MRVGIRGLAVLCAFDWVRGADAGVWVGDLEYATDGCAEVFNHEVAVGAFDVFCPDGYRCIWLSD